MKFLYLIFFLLFALHANAKLQNEDFSTVAEMQAKGLTSPQAKNAMLHDSKVFVNGLSKLLSEAITDGDIGGSPLTTKGDIFTRNVTEDARLPVGTNGYILKANSATATGLEWAVESAGAAINPNHVINGNFDFWQRGTSSTVLTSGYYAADRWVTTKTGGTWTLSRQPITVGDIDGSQYLKRINNTTASLVTSRATMEHRVEDITKYAGKTFTLSFYAKADAAKNFSIEFLKAYGAGGSPLETAVCVAKLGATTAWQRFTVTCVVPDNVGKTIGTGSYLALNLWAEAGSDFNARTNTLGTQNIVLDIAQVKLEEGSIETPFVLAGGTLAGELEACQRYYEKSYNINDNPATSTIVGSWYGNGVDSVTPRVPIIFKASKRALPAINIYTSLGLLGSCRDISNVANRTTAIQAEGHSSFTIQINSALANTIHSCHWVADAEL